MQTIGIVGHGAFGAFLGVLLKRFAPEIEVRFHSRSNSADGRTFFTISDVAQCDAVILAVPIHALEEWVKKIVPLMREDGVLVDVATVKKHSVNLLKKYAKGRKYIATHPMFGPESYQKKGGDVFGLRVVVCDSTLPEEKVATFCQSLQRFGFKVVRMSADQHDKSSAQTLFLTHLIGQTVAKAGFVRTDIDTISFGFLMDAVESVKHDKKLFQDVFRYNPYCKKVMQKFGVAERAVQKLLAKQK
jgi:prephenate dehydrogenase